MYGRLWRQKQVCYLLKRYLYGMQDSPRGYAKLFEGICQDFNLTQPKTDECVYVKIENHQKDHDGQQGNTQYTDLSPLHKIQSNVDQHNRVYNNCAYPIGILIGCSYMDGDLFFINGTQLAKEFETHCNTRIIFDWCCFYYIVRNSLVALLEALCAQKWLLKVQSTGICPSNMTHALWPEPSVLTKSCTLTKKFRDGVCLTVIHYQLPFQPKPMHLSLSLRNQFRIQILKSSRIFRIYAGDYCMCRFTQYPKSVGHFPFLPNTWPKQALFIWAQPKRFFDIYKAGKRHQLRGAFFYYFFCFAGAKPERTSSMGYIFFINNATVSWWATRSSIVALNACEAEVVSLGSACHEGVYLRNLCNELEFSQTSPTTMYEDCQSAVALSKEIDPKESHYVGHMSLKGNDLMLHTSC